LQFEIEKEKARQLEIEKQKENDQQIEIEKQKEQQRQIEIAKQKEEIEPIETISLLEDTNEQQEERNRPSNPYVDDRATDADPIPPEQYKVTIGTVVERTNEPVHPYHIPLSKYLKINLLCIYLLIFVY
jgi:hypothetical protein